MKNEIKTYRWTEKCTSLYLMIIFLAFPLYYQNNYIDILEAKTSFFIISSCIYLVIGTVSIGLVKLSTDTKPAGSKQSGKRKKNNVPAETEKPKKKILIQDIFFLVFVAAVIVSTLFSVDIENAWLAPDCKSFGAMIILICCGLYCLVSRGYFFNNIVKGCLTAGLLAVFVLTVMNRYGIDPLDMYSNLLQNQKYKYLSTIGNANILSNYVCVFAPLVMGMYLFTKEKIWLIITGILTYTGIMAGIASNSDSFFLGTGAAAVFLMWFAFDNKDKLERFLSLNVICAAALFTLKMFNRMSEYNCKWSGLQEAIIDSIPWLIMIAVLIILTAAVSRMDRETDFRKLRIVIFGVLGAGILIGIIYIVRINISGAEDSYFFFDDNWGTNRGFVWTRTCQLFSELPFYQQMTGIGPGGFRDFFAEYNVERAMMGKPDFSDPHSEPLYFLVCTGISGAIGYFGMIISSIITCTKIRKAATVVLAAIFTSWLAQGMVNNPLVFTTPYLFIFLAMSRYEAVNNYKNS